MTLRGLAERLTRRLVVRRRLPTPFENVRLYVSSEAGLRYLKPRIDGVDSSLLRVAADHVRPGDVVGDIGANIGLFAMSAAARTGATGHVVAVDADTSNVDMLSRSAQAQPSSSAKIDIVPAAVSNKVGFASFNIAKRNRSTNSLEGFGSSRIGGVRETQTVPTITLDSLVEYFPFPDMVKIDVEGAESLVLAGGSKVLNNHPTLHCEVSEHSAGAVQQLLNDFGYTLFDADDAPPRMPVQGKLPFNVLAVHIN